MIATSFKAQSLSSFGHVQMMPDNRTVKNLFNGKPVTKNHTKDTSTDGRITSHRISAK